MTGGSGSIRITFEKAVYGGLFLGRHGGKAVLVPHAVPGETAEVRILSEKKDYCTGEIVSVVSESSQRIRPACPLYSRCGGCSYLHVPYEREIEFKTDVLLDSLIRIAGMGKGTIPAPDIITAGRLNYRSHASIKVRDGLPGFYKRGTNEIVPISETGCLILEGALNDWIRSGRAAPASDFRLAADGSGRVISSLDEIPLVVEREGGLVFHRDIDCFFQSNRLLRGALLDSVTRLAGSDGSLSFLDIGCGVGFFTLTLARCMNRGHGVDISPGNIRYARENAARNGIAGVTFEAVPSSRIHPGRVAHDIVIMDPPRAGIDRRTRNTVLAMRPRAIVYVSCNPATFARDVKDFAAGGYRMDSLALADMFPCTQHVEVIARLVPGHAANSRA